MNPIELSRIKESLPEKYRELPDDIIVAMLKSIAKYDEVYKSLSDK